MKFLGQWSFPQVGMNTIGLQKRKLKAFGIKVTQKFKDINLNRKDVGDTTKSGMGGPYPGSGEIGYILIYKTWKIFFSRNCARKAGTSGYCTEITAENSRELEDLFPEIIPNVDGRIPEGMNGGWFNSLTPELQKKIIVALRRNKLKRRAFPADGGARMKRKIKKLVENLEKK